MRNILLIEDNPGDQELFKEAINDMPFECSVFMASNAEEGLTRMKEHQVDLIVLDVMMPGGNGYELCNILKFGSSYKEVPILMLTGREQEMNPKIGKKMDIFYMQKPCTAKGLLEIFQHILK